MEAFRPPFRARAGRAGGSVPRHAADAAHGGPEALGDRPPATNDRTAHPAGGHRVPARCTPRIASRILAGASSSGHAGRFAGATRECAVFDGRRRMCGTSAGWRLSYTPWTLPHSR